MEEITVSDYQGYDGSEWAQTQPSDPGRNLCTSFIPFLTTSRLRQVALLQALGMAKGQPKCTLFEWRFHIRDTIANLTRLSA